MSGETEPPAGLLPRWLVYAIFLGLYLTLRGYHSLDGDQAYRLPLLLHRQDPQLYAQDPFVRAFDDFNPHRGSLLVLDLATRSLGLPAGLFVVFVLTFALTCFAIDRLACGVWPEPGPGVGLVAIGLLLAAKAGNIGTNHIFEAMVLDRQIAFALGWLAIAQQVVHPDRCRALVIAAIASATLIHPSAGLQLAVVLIASSTAWSVLGRWTNVSMRDVRQVYLGMAVAVVPGVVMNLASGPGLMAGMPQRDFWLLSVELQSPQHMLPHLWRMPQWLAFGSYFALAALTVCNQKLGSPFERDAKKQPSSFALSSPQARLRLIVSLAVIAAGLAVSWYAIEWLHAVRVTVFQPFRMATVARGIALILVGGRIVGLWQTGRWLPRMRAILITVAVTGDWLMVVVTIAELAASAAAAVLALLTTQHASLKLRSLRVANSPRTDSPTLEGGARAGAFPPQHAEHSSATPEPRFSSPPHTFSLALAIEAAVLFGTLALGLNFLGHHDTEYGHLPLLAAIATGALVGLPGLLRSQECSRTISSKPPSKIHGGRGSRRAGWVLSSLQRVLSQNRATPFRWTSRRKRAILAVAWAVPLAALLASAVPVESSVARSPFVRGLIARCRFLAVPTDDVERLAIWCRDHTPVTARFIGPPGPKTFRLWSQRSLAFNRSASPYHASGLSDWFARFQDHVGFHGPALDFVQGYVTDRHGFEARYDRLSDGDRAALALRQGAEYVITQAPKSSSGRVRSPDVESPLELLHVEGRYAVSRVRSAQLAQRHR